MPSRTKQLEKELDVVNEEGSMAVHIVENLHAPDVMRWTWYQTYGECVQRATQIRQELNDIRYRCQFIREEILRLRTHRFGMEHDGVCIRHPHDESICARLKEYHEELTYLSG